jgi:hypothetical protein
MSEHDLTIDVASESLFAPTAADFDLAKELGELLDKTYPGHMWAVTADHHNGVVDIKNLRLSERWGIVVKISTLATDPQRVIVKRLAGELLERYRVARGKFNVADLQHLKPWARPKLDLGL